MQKLIERIYKAKVISLILVIVIAGGIALATVRFARAQQAAPEEITLTVQQQQPIRDLLAERDQALKTTGQQYDDRIAGAIKVVMAQTPDPKTGKAGLSTSEWVAQGDGKGGFKFITVQAAQELAKKAQAASGQ